MSDIKDIHVKEQKFILENGLLFLHSICEKKSFSLEYRFFAMITFSHIS